MSSREVLQSDLLASAYRRWFEELSESGIFTTDTSLVVRSWNSWLEAQTGIASAAAIGRPLFELYPSLAERGFDRYYRDALNGQVHVLSERFHKHLLPIPRNVQSIGLSEMAQSARVAPLRNDGGVIGTITVIEDVTERVVTERELRSQIAVSERARADAEDASKLKDEFLATLSHEIRTPLNAVLGWARILRTAPKIKSRARALEVIERNAESQLRLVEDLLDMARVISGKLRLDVKTLDLREVARAAIDVVSPAATAKHIEIKTIFDDQPAVINGDIDRLQQAVWNVMSNAVKFTEPGGQIEIAVARLGTGVELFVRDTGQGISRDFLPFIFDRFRQADSSASRRHGGLGLGLALVRQIVELHGGAVTADSGGVNRGSTFILRFPSANPGAAITTRLSQAAPVSLTGVHVLIVDDNDDAREMLVIALREFGAVVRSAGSSRDALALLSANSFTPDVLISDIGLPDMDGYEMLRQIRLLPHRAVKSVPAIAVTAYANPEDQVRSAVAGYQLHLAKPIDPDKVAAAVVQVATTRPRPIKSPQKRR